MTKPAWIVEAEKYIGTKEYPGAASNPVILAFWKLARLSGIKSDMVPWCAGFACAMLESVGVRSPRSDGARNFLTWGSALASPIPGCIVVFQRPGGYHVGFVVSQDKRGNLHVLGGNQGDAVSIAAFGRDRVVGYHWPTGQPVPSTALSVVESIAASKSEV
jgi:uncharacterized protein (TIGR02594 family)